LMINGPNPFNTKPTNFKSHRKMLDCVLTSLEQSPTVTLKRTYNFSFSLKHSVPILFMIYMQLMSINAVSGFNTIATIAGTGATTGTSLTFGDGGSATSAVFNKPVGICGSSTGSMYLTELAGFRIRKVDGTTGIVSTLSGSGVAITNGADANGDGGSATAALIGGSYSVIRDTNANLYFADVGSNKVRLISGGIISLFAGVGGPFNSAVGEGGLSATSASLSNERGLWKDTTGNVFIADSGNKKIRKVGTDGIIVTVAGTGASVTQDISATVGDGGSATSAIFGTLEQLFGDTNGYLFMADRVTATVRKITLSLGIIVAVAGSGGLSNTQTTGSTPATSTGFNFVSGVYGDSMGVLYLACHQDHRVRSVTTDGMTQILSGSGTASVSASDLNGDGGAVTAATFNVPYYSFLDSSDGLLISDVYNNKIRFLSNVVLSLSPSTQPSPSPSVQPSASPSYYQNLLTQITTVIGTGSSASNGDGGQASLTTVNLPNGVFAETNGRLYVSEKAGNKIRVVDPTTSIVSTLAPLGFISIAGPKQLFKDTSNQMYVVLSVAQMVVAIDMSSKQCTPVVGSVVNAVGSTGDGGQATSATINTPEGFWKDTAGAMYISEATGNRIRKVATNGIIFLFGGDGASSSNDIPATSAIIGGPGQLFADSLGVALYFTITFYRVRSIDLSNGEAFH
jgi:hypothetical protein